VAEPARILVVDDEAAITELVSMALRYEGFDVATASSGRGALAAVRGCRPDLVVLDVMLGDLDGFDVVARLRRDGSDVPVVFLTARDATADAVAGLSLGGDDYVTKPFSIDELVARVRSVLRRTRAPGAVSASQLTFADLELDEGAHEVWRAGRRIELTATEFKLLRYLLANPRRVVSKAQILEAVWGDFDGDVGVVETYVSYLRRKIDDVEPHLLHTVRGVGYSLRLPS